MLENLLFQYCMSSKVKSDVAAKCSRGLPAELAAKLVVKEALRSRGLKDDKTCLAVDIIPSDVPVLPSIPRKTQNMLSSLLFGKKSLNSVSKATNKLSAVGVVGELFEEVSAMLAERLGKDFLQTQTLGYTDVPYAKSIKPPLTVYQ
ncbi:hypothetical protein GH714_005885 [Hevea brasiliensis]|uniref:PPM-type phosphatase domain-containing protein n=1 Tax=Hevea brasiliensis TaxID=3981 RepID=A0A6A6KHC1_HEVBR|nr:hypothetical protein GH714_005885 [Hevea brasiliensis]